MDKDVLKKRLMASCEVHLNKALAAVESAPDGQWIAASEWAVRAAFQDLTRECFQDMVQARVNAAPSGKQTAFSPSRGRGSSGQGQA